MHLSPIECLFLINYSESNDAKSTKEDLHQLDREKKKIDDDDGVNLTSLSGKSV